MKHRPEIEQLDYVVLENDNKRRIDIVCSHFPGDSFKEGFLGMRANVDDFDEGLSYFKAQGYSVFGTSHEIVKNKVVLLKNGDDTFVALFHHKK